MKKFFLELAFRFISKKPAFFTTIQYISAVCALVTGLPAFLAQYGIILPDNISILENKTIAIAAMVAALIAQLPVQNGVEIKK